MSDFNLQSIDLHNCIDLQVFQVGMEECESGHHYGPVARTNYLFHLVAAGKGTFITDKAGTFELKKGQGFLIYPDQITTYYADIDQPWTYYWIELNGLQVNQFFRSRGIKIEHPILTLSDESTERRAVYELQQILDQSNPTANFLLGHTYLFLDCIGQASSQVDMNELNISKKQSYFDEIHEFISYHYSEDITVDQISEECRLNRSYLNSLFKAEFGVSIQQFLIEFRLAKSLQLLSETTMSIKEISQSVGYHDQLHFSKSFKKKYGVSPKAWRSRQISSNQ